MNEFRTTFDIPRSSYKIHYASKCMFLGSCFSEHIGNRLSERKFLVDLNPFGILYNPGSIYKGLMRLIEGMEYTPSELTFHDDLWVSLDHHGRFSHADRDACLKNINSRLRESAGFLREAQAIFLTFGTSWFYEWKDTGARVANCHKIPADRFYRKLLRPQEIVQMYSGLVETLTALNPELYFVFTVSPIRHWKDGATANQHSKSILHCAIHELKEAHPEIMYFPAYELMMDDLRDYRFYAEDMLHLNSQSVGYIWEKFQATFMDTNALEPMGAVEKVLLAAAHRPEGKRKDAVRRFVSQQLQAIKRLKKRFPQMDFTREESHFRSLIS